MLRSGASRLHLVRTWATTRRGFASVTPPSSVAAPSSATGTADSSLPLQQTNPTAAGIEQEQELQQDILAPDAWTLRQPTRMIAHKLLDRDKHMLSMTELYDDLSNSCDLFRSRRHFKHCLKLMRAKNRVQVICLGPESIGSSVLKFAVKLTGQGQRTYLWFRQGHRAWASKQITDGTTTGTGGGLTDAL